MRFQVLGHARAVGPEGEVLDLGARKPRSVVAALALRAGRPVPADTLVDLVWGDDAPRAAHGALHAYLSGLRRVLEPDRPARGAASVIETTDHGYVLRVEPADVDTHAFVAEVREVERVLAPLLSQLEARTPSGGPTPPETAARVDALEATLAAWSGEPYADLPDHPDVVAARAGLEQARAAAEELRLAGLLALGEHASVLATTESLTGRFPLRERLWALHALALVRGGRQADALAALRTVRAVLADELGLDPGAELRTLEQAVLEQAPGLALPTHESFDRTAGARSGAETAHESFDRTIGAVATTRHEVGRDAEHATLDAALDRATSGFAAVQVVGEPGIGKSTLVDGLADRARARGLRVAVGRCSADDGAPPLWPWRAVLAGLDRTAELAAPLDATDPASGFATWDAIAAAVIAESRANPLLVVLDDLHWADEASLRTLTHLVATAPDDARLAVVATRRPHPEPTDRYAAAVEAFARRHADQVDLVGLSDAAADTVLRAAHDGEVAPDVLARWRDRAAGNPFFLIELARLGAEPAASVPATVRDVVARRLAELPDDVLDTLRTTAVVGRHAHLATVAAADDLDPDAAADRLDVAMAAGLVSETGPEEYTFGHALTQEAVAASLTGTQTARRHARVARAMEGAAGAVMDPAERTTELARHWLAAGPSHVDAAWRAARSAATQARSLTSYADAMRLREAAVEAQRRVPGGDEADRYDLLLELTIDAALAARWPTAERSAIEATALGRALGDPTRVATAIRSLTVHSIWLPHDLDVVLEDTIDDLRWALAEVGDDTATRCVLQLALAIELYYDEHAAAEARALVDTGLALARRVDDRRLLAWALRAAWVACWRPADAVERSGWVEEALAVARETGDQISIAFMLASLAVSRMELGDREGWERYSAEADAVAERERLMHVLVSSHVLNLSLAAMRGDAAAVRHHLDLLELRVPDIAVPMQEMVLPAGQLFAVLWDAGAVREVAQAFVAVHEEVGEGATNVHQVLARAGETEALRAHMAAYPIPHEHTETWSVLADWSCEAEAASVLGDAGVAAHALQVMAPYDGYFAMGGMAVTGGPVDGYLALARATLGETAAATAHADAADRIAAEWDLPRYRDWLAGHRERLGI